MSIKEDRDDLLHLIMEAQKLKDRTFGIWEARHKMVRFNRFRRKELIKHDWSKWEEKVDAVMSRND